MARTADCFVIVRADAGAHRTPGTAPSTPARVRRARGPLAAMMLAAAASGASAQPTVVIAERDFAAGSIVASVGGWGNVGTMTLAPASTGGNPGAWTEVRISVAGGTPPAPFQAGSSTFGVIMLEGRSIDPAALGGIATLEVTVDSQFLASSGVGCNCSGQLAVVRQNGVLYAAVLPNTTQVWATVSRGNLRATDFGRLAFQDPVIIDTTQNPDFSVGGAPMEVGIARGNSNGPGPFYASYFTSTGLDNLVFTARRCLLNACSIADVCPIGGPAPGSCPDGLITGDDFNAFIAAFAAGEPLADVVSIGGLPPGDGLITGDDFNAFIAAFASGCP